MLKRNTDFIRNNLKAVLLNERNIITGFNYVKVENVKTKNEMISCKVNFNNKGRILAHSLYDPIIEAKKITKKINFKNDSLIFVFGLGMAYHIDEILKKATPSSAIVIFEPLSEVFYNAMSNRDMTEILGDSRVTLLTGMSLERVLTIITYKLKELYFDVAHNIQYIELTYFKKFECNLINFFVRLKDFITLSWKSLGNCHIDHNIGVIQTITNIDSVINNIGINKLTNAYKNKPAIIVASGPSMDKNIEYLRSAKGRAIIIACESILSKLLDNNIVPDIVANMERLGIYEFLFLQLKHMIPENIVFAAPALTQPQNLELFRENKKIFWFQRAVGTQEYFDEIIHKGLLTNGISVSFTALALAYEMGFDKIAITGLDLAYANGGRRAYCSGVSQEAEDNAQKRRKKGLITTVKDYEGHDIETSIHLKEQLTTFEHFTRGQKDVKVFDATEGGAKKEGMEIITLKDFIDKYCTENIKDVNTVINEKKEKPTANVNDNIKRKLIEKMKKDWNRFDSIGKELEECFTKIEESYKMVIKSQTESVCKNALKNIKNTNKIINKIQDNKFLYMYYRGSINAMVKEISQIQESDGLKLLNIHLRIQYSHLFLLVNTFKINLDVFKLMINYLENKVNNNDLACYSNNVVAYGVLKEVLEKNNTETDFLYDYFNISLYGKLSS